MSRRVDERVTRSVLSRGNDAAGSSHDNLVNSCELSSIAWCIHDPRLASRSRPSGRDSGMPPSTASLRGSKHDDDSLQCLHRHPTSLV